MDDKNDSLTVIIPIYNGGVYLRETLDTILSSSYRNIELLLIDDGSTDNSAQIIAEYMRRDGRIHYIHQENAGIVAARNAGIVYATGEYVCFCDQDDLVEPDMYRLLIKKMSAENAEMGMCSTGRLIENQKSIYEILANAVYKGGEVYSYLLYPLLFRGYSYPFIMQDNYLYGTVWKCIFRKEFIQKNKLMFCKFIDYEDDWLFVTKALIHAKSVITCNEVGYYWRIHGKSKSHVARHIENMPERFQQYDEYIWSYLSESVPDNILSEYRKVNYCEHYLELFRNAEGAVDKKAAIMQIKEYLQKTDYKQVLDSNKKHRNASLRGKAVFSILLCLGVAMAIYMSRVITRLETLSTTLHILAKFERWMKLVKK